MAAVLAGGNRQPASSSAVSQVKGGRGTVQAGRASLPLKKSIRLLVSVTRSEAISPPTTISSPVSSQHSRRAAASAVSAGSIFPPGNSA